MLNFIFLVGGGDAQSKRDFLAKTEFLTVKTVSENLIKKVGMYEGCVWWVYFRPDGELVAISGHGRASKAA